MILLYMRGKRGAIALILETLHPLPSPLLLLDPLLAELICLRLLSHEILCRVSLVHC